MCSFPYAQIHANLLANLDNLLSCMIQSIQKSYHPKWQFVASRHFYVVCKDKGIGDVGDLVEGFAVSADLKSPFAIHAEIPLCLVIFNSMIVAQLVDSETFTCSPNFHGCCGQSIEKIGILEIDFVWFLHLLYRHIVGEQ